MGRSIWRTGLCLLPVLVLTCDDDCIVLAADRTQLADQLPNPTMKVIAETDHLSHEERPRQFTKAVSRFMRKIGY
jgi:pimeloyl-ACP methyl ester carboxylesterase